MAKRVLRGLSYGKIPCRLGCNMSSPSRVFSFAVPIFSWRSSNKIWMKMRLADVVSSSFRWMAEKTCQPIESDDSRWPKNLAMFRSLLVS